MSESPEETIRRFINEIVGQTEADIIIGSRSCAPGDGLNYGNMERLVREAPDVLDLLASLRQRQEETRQLLREAFNEDGWASRLATSGSDQGHELRDRIIAARGTT